MKTKFRDCVIALSGTQWAAYRKKISKLKMIIKNLNQSEKCD